MRQKLIFLVVLISLAASCTKHQPADNSVTPTGSPGVSRVRNSTDVVKVSAEPAEITRNQTSDVAVKVSIEKGFHVNANPPTFPYLKATELEFPQSPELSVSFIVYPDPVTKSFAFAEKPLAVYEGETVLKVKLKADKTAKVGTQNLSGKLRVQACDDQVCYAPGTLDVSLPLTIK
ncbi:MAG TPA: protein-disulfide reductase DsbD domain-containing protein [Pyrinomonadaceae bacterium]